MSISGVLSTAVTGLFASQAALRTTANNIVNVNTKDYSREVVHLENIVVGGKSAGVKISDIQRIVDRFLQAAGLDARARASAANTEDQFNQRFQSILGRPDSRSTISARINQLFGVIADLAIDPSGQILRQATLASMQDMADEINRVSGAIQNLRNEANQQIQEQVIAANEALARIHEINPLIVRQRAIGGGSAGGGSVGATGFGVAVTAGSGVSMASGASVGVVPVDSAVAVSAVGVAWPVSPSSSPPPVADAMMMITNRAATGPP